MTFFKHSQSNASAAVPFFVRFLVLTALLLGTCSVAEPASGKPTTRPGAWPGDGSLPFTNRPNVVLIIADDQAYTDFGFMGHPHVRTPNLDRLAARSARYPNGYVPSSVCRPSLATLLTGLYPHQHGIHFNHPSPGFARLRQLTKEEYERRRAAARGLIRSARTLPRILADHGYDCLQTGKFWEGHYRNAGFTHGMTIAKPSPDPAFGNLRLPDGSLVAHGNGDAGLNIGRTTMQPIWDFIDSHLERAFFIWYAPFLPHTPHNAPRKYVKLYANDPKIPPRYREYYAACSWFDATVGELVSYLEKKELAGNTLFVFVIDNGWAPSTQESRAHVGYEVDRYSKRSPFDRGLRTPILIRWDGRVKPATHRAICGSTDIVPTILSAVRLKAEAKGTPGNDLMPSARGAARLKDRPVFGEIYPGDATSLGYPERDLAYRWVREGEFKLIVPRPHGGSVWRSYVKRPALFNVVRDPREQHDLSGGHRYTPVMNRLSKLLDDWWTPDDD